MGKKIDFKVVVPSDASASANDIKALIHSAVRRGLKLKDEQVRVTRMRKTIHNAGSGRFASKKSAKAAPEKHVGE
jgi:hypothetical protein